MVLMGEFWKIYCLPWQAMRFFMTTIGRGEFFMSRTSLGFVQRLFACLLGLGASFAVNAALFTYTANLDGASENPPNASPGTGFAEITWDDAMHTLRVQASFSGLTGNVTAAHIHCCTTAPNNVGVATMTPSFIGFPLGVFSGTYDNTFDLFLASSWNAAFITSNGGTPSTATAALLAGLDAGEAYFNIHTTTFPGGEIRGFLNSSQVPEPASLALFGIALISLVAFRRRIQARSPRAAR
jgi:hypothetical protein